MRYVVDPSVSIKWFIKEASHSNADRVLEAMVRNPESFAVPELFLYEMFSLLNKHHPKAADVFGPDLERLIRSGVLRYPMTNNIYARASRFIGFGLTGFDAIYPALAEEIGGWWVTFDTRAHFLLRGEDLSIDLSENLFPTIA